MGSIRTGTSGGDTLLLQAYDTLGAAYTTFATLTAGNPPTFAVSGASTWAAGTVGPATNDSAALGSATVSWADLFLASGGVINWANGNVTLTHSGGLLSLAGGTLLINSPTAYGRLNEKLEINMGSGFGGMALSSWSATDNDSPMLDFNKSGNSTIGIHGLVANGEPLGRIVFNGSDGTNFEEAALIRASVDGVAADNDMPGRLEFYTTPAGSTSLVEAMRINSAQVVRLSGSTYTANGTVSTSGGNGTLTTASDERLKRIQGPFTPGLAEILMVKPIRYKWRKDIPEAGIQPEHVYAGFSAQNVRDALGDLAVGQRSDGILSLQDRAILGALVNAVKELSARVGALEPKPLNRV